MDNEIEFTDRYQALGIPYPDPDTMCKGQCEGIGLYPVRQSDTDLTEYEQGEIARQIASGVIDDGAFFITCPVCDGTGKRPPATA